MRYSEIDLQCEDILWFGTDSNGYILAFTSGGCGCVPEFVCRSKEETNLLEEFFSNNLKASLDNKPKFSINDASSYEDAIILSQKGIFVYDVSFDDGYADNYSIISSPTTPLHIDNLPDNIKSIIRDHIINNAKAGDKYIQVKHAY